MLIVILPNPVVSVESVDVLNEQAVRSGPATAGEAISGQAFFVGTAVRGKASEPTLIRNLTEYKKVFGGHVSGNLVSEVSIATSVSDTKKSFRTNRGSLKKMVV